MKIDIPKPTIYDFYTNNLTLYTYEWEDSFRNSPIPGTLLHSIDLSNFNKPIFFNASVSVIPPYGLNDIEVGILCPIMNGQFYEYLFIVNTCYNQHYVSHHEFINNIICLKNVGQIKIFGYNAGASYTYSYVTLTLGDYV